MCSYTHFLARCICPHWSAACVHELSRHKSVCLCVQQPHKYLHTSVCTLKKHPAAYKSLAWDLVSSCHMLLLQSTPTRLLETCHSWQHYSCLNSWQFLSTHGGFSLHPGLSVPWTAALLQQMHPWPYLSLSLSQAHFYVLVFCHGTANHSKTQWLHTTTIYFLTILHLGFSPALTCTHSCPWWSVGRAAPHVIFQPQSVVVSGFFFFSLCWWQHNEKAKQKPEGFLRLR